MYTHIIIYINICVYIYIHIYIYIYTHTIQHIIIIIIIIIMIYIIICHYRCVPASRASEQPRLRTADSAAAQVRGSTFA